MGLDLIRNNFILAAFESFSFCRFIKLGVTADSLEGMYTKAHKAIRADPAPKPVAKVRNVIIKG